MQRLLLFFTFTLLAVVTARAQIEVSLDLPRHAYLRGEAMAAKISIRNLSGHDVVFADTDGKRWFGFDVSRGRDTPVGPRDPNYQNPPITVLAGETIERRIDLIKLYPINELDSYQIRALIYYPEAKKYFTSAPAKVDVSEGKILWRETAGVPDGKEAAGELRNFSLVMFQTTKTQEVYARVEDQATSSVLATYPIGKMISGSTPMHEFGPDNTLYVLHMNGPSQYALSKVGINGEWLGQSLWSSATGRCAVRKKPNGDMVVVGAQRIREAAPGAPEVPKLSDRPMALPK